MSFLAGALVGGLLTAAIMWDRHDHYCCGVYYCGRGYWGRPGYWDGGWRRPVHYERNVNVRTGDININRGDRVGKWEHRPEHRGNINYKNRKTKAKNSKDLRTRPVDRDVARGYKRDAKRPATRDVKRPDTRDSRRPDKSRQIAGAKRPETRDRQQQVRRDGKKTQRRDANLKRPEGARPQTREARKPESRPAAKPQARDTARKLQQKPATRPAKRQSKGSDAFKKSNARMDRAASNRGNKSVNRSSGRAPSRSGGGKARGNRG